MSKNQSLIMAMVLIDSGLCNGCGSCAGVCSMRCIKVDGKAVFTEKGCIACGHCAAVCPVGAVSLFGRAVETPANIDLATVVGASSMRRSVR